MKGMLRKLFNIYPGEEQNAIRFALLGFLWSFAVSLGWKNSDALFLLNVGAEELPFAYALIACFMIAIASIMIFAYKQYAAHRIFMSVLILGIGFFAAAHFSLRYHWGEESKWLWYILRIFGWIFFTLVNTSYWTFLDQFYHIRDSKRLFSLFLSAIFVGMATTGLIMRTGLLEFQEITLLIIVILIATCAWALKLSKSIQPLHGEHDIDAAPASGDQTFRQTVQAVFKSRFTLLLMALNFFIFVSIVLAEYNYMFAFQEAFGGGYDTPIANEEDAPLMLFLGQSIAVVSIFNLIFGLFAYSRLVRRFGLGGTLLITPIILIITYVGWPLDTSLLFPLMAFFVSESTLYVIDDNNFNLMLNGVPTKIKYKIRLIIESFFEPFGTLLSALLLSITAIDSKAVALFFAFILLVISLKLRKLYPKAIYSNLMENAIRFDKTPKEWLPVLSKNERKASESRLLAILKMGDLRAQEFAIEGLLDFEDPTILERMLDVIDQSSSKTKQLLIAKLHKSAFAEEPRVIDQLLAWDLEDNDVELKCTLHLFLAKEGLLSPQKALIDLKSSELKLVSAALIALKRSSAYSNPHSVTELRTQAAQHLQELLGSGDEEAIQMGLTVLSADATSEDINLLIHFLRSGSLPIARQAAQTIAAIATNYDSHFSPRLFDILTTQSDSEIRIALLQALGKIADTSLIYEMILNSVHLRPSERRLMEKIVIQMGLRTVPTLLSIVKDASLHERCRLLAGRILGKIALPQLRANLYPIFNDEIQRAFFYYYHYLTIQETYPEYDLHVLKDALLAGYHSVMDFIIQLLGVSGEIEDSELLSRSMRSANPKVRSQVIETLERTCDTSLFRLLQPLVDDLPLAEKLRYYGKPRFTLEGSNDDSPEGDNGLEELLSWMRLSPSLTDQVAAAAVSASLKLPHWQQTLKQQMRGKEEIFNRFAYDLLEA